MGSVANWASRPPPAAAPIQPLPWWDERSEDAGSYLAWLHREVARTTGGGLETVLTPAQCAVLTGLRDWLAAFPHDSLLILWDWLQSSSDGVDICLEIAPGGALRALWRPAGAEDGLLACRGWDHDSGSRAPMSRIAPGSLEWRAGAACADGARPLNELMLIRCAGALLSPAAPRDTPAWAVDHILICAVRAALNHLVATIRRRQPVRLRQELVFDLERRPCDSFASSTGAEPFVTSWKLAPP